MSELLILALQSYDSCADLELYDFYAATKDQICLLTLLRILCSSWIAAR